MTAHKLSWPNDIRCGSQRSDIDLRGEGGAAAAGLRRIRIHEVEALLHQRLFVVEDHAVQINEALGINEDADAVKVIDTVTLARLRIKANVVAQAAASAALHAHAQSALLG